MSVIPYHTIITTIIIWIGYLVVDRIFKYRIVISLLWDLLNQTLKWISIFHFLNRHILLRKLVLFSNFISILFLECSISRRLLFSYNFKSRWFPICVSLNIITVIDYKHLGTLISLNNILFLCIIMSFPHVYKPILR